MSVAARKDGEMIPVTLVSARGGLVPLDADTAFLRLPANTGHGHADGVQCIACAMHGDVRAMLFDLLEGARLGLRPVFNRVLIDVSGVADSTQVVAALTGKLPAQALRDHMVARRFYLVG